jgi:hypothetical protein
MNDLKFAFRQSLKNPSFTVVLALAPIGANASGQMPKSIFKWSRIALSKSKGKMPKRPVMTRVLRVQSLSVRTTDEVLSRVCVHDGCVDSMATPKRGNFPGGSVVMKANTKSPGDSAAARTTHGRRFAPDKSVNGNAARTISPICGMSAKIGVLVPRFDVGVGIEIRLRREKIESPPLLCYPSHHFPGQAIISGFHYNEHQLRRAARTTFRRNAHDTGFIDLDHHRFHVSKLTYRRTLPSFIYLFGISDDVRAHDFLSNTGLRHE